MTTSLSTLQAHQKLAQLVRPSLLLPKLSSVRKILVYLVLPWHLKYICTLCTAASLETYVEQGSTARRGCFSSSDIFFLLQEKAILSPEGKPLHKTLLEGGPDGDRDRAMAQLGPSALRLAHQRPCTEIFARPQRGRSGSTQPQRLTFTQRRHAARAQRSTPRCSFDPSQ